MKNLLRVQHVKNDITQSDLAIRVKAARQTIIAIESGRFIHTDELLILEDVD